MIEYQTGRFEAGARLLERPLANADGAPDWPVYEKVAVATTISGIARITGVFEHFELAEKAAETVVSSPRATPSFSMTAQCGLALMAVMQEDGPKCEELYHQFQSTDEFYPHPMVEARLLGLLAQGMGDLDRAVSHFEDGLAFCIKGGYGPELAWTYRDYAEALIKGRGQDRAPAPEMSAKVNSLLEEGLSIATELGMPPLMEQVAALQEQASALPTRTEAYPDGLSQREVEVLRLICVGKTDREIGEELVISVRTVGNHVSNILNKMGAANRTEAATYAASNGLATDPE